MGRLMLGAWFSRWLERHVPSVEEDLSALDRADGLDRAVPSSGTETLTYGPATEPGRV